MKTDIQIDRQPSIAHGITQRKDTTPRERVGTGFWEGAKRMNNSDKYS